LTSFGIKLVT